MNDDQFYTIYEGDLLGNVTGVQTRLVSMPICPDLLEYDMIGVADNMRGKVVRAFFWLMRMWPVARV